MLHYDLVITMILGKLRLMGVSGVIDWVIQRISSVVISSYVLWLFAWILTADSVDYQAWKALFSNFWMQVYTVSTVIATCAHAWVGMWTIGSDYLTKRQFGDSAFLVRATYNAFCGLLLFLYAFWSFYIMWTLT